MAHAGPRGRLFARRLQRVPAPVLITHLLPPTAAADAPVCSIITLLCVFYGIRIAFVNDLGWVTAAVFYQIINT